MEFQLFLLLLPGYNKGLFVFMILNSLIDLPLLTFNSNGKKITLCQTQIVQH